jgi:GAF domain-containing protein
MRKKRSRPASNRAKARPVKRLTQRGRKVAKTHPSSSSADELARVTWELHAAREQYAAISEVLRVISQSNFDLQAILQSLAETAARLCRSDGAVIFQLKGGVYHFAAGYSLSSAFLEIERRSVISPGPETVIGRAAMTRKVARIDDALADQLYEKKDDARVEGNRSMIGVPLLRDAEPVVVIGLGRRRVDPFGDREIELATSFAAQAVIAIENARLLNELRQRTADLTEALEQQTATSEVLQVISSSAGDLEPVFATVLEKAVRICDAKFGTLYLREGEKLRLVAARDVPPAFAAAQGAAPFDPAPGGMLESVIKTGRTVHLSDLAATRAYLERHPVMVQAIELGGIRTVVGVPMLKDAELIGLIGIFRQEVRPFTDKQVALLTNFAAQAVIAIENARLLNELRESLEQQTATAQVLEVISRSAGDLAHVFVAILENATRICEAKFGTLYIKEGDGFRASAMHNAPAAYEEARAQPVHPSQHTTLWRAANSKRPVQIADVTLERGYLEGEPFVVSAVKMGGYRSVLSVPMIKEDQVVGVITIFRQEVSSFGEKHVSLLQNFAAQAVIAIENARLLNDLRDSTKQLRAQSDELADLNEQLEQRVADQVGEIERMGRLRRFLPPQVADLIVASGTEKQLESHRREITALFCDLRGFTGFTEIADAEDVMSLLRDYHAATGEIIIKYSGTLERYAGDGVMVIFNDPVPIENPPLQAVLMALQMREAIGTLTEKWRRLGHDIGFGIGIAHGYATLGTIGFEGRFDYAAIGTVSNVASRLCDEAKPGQILISPRVLMAVNDVVTVEAVGEFELKGIRRPVAAYNVVAASSQSA